MFETLNRVREVSLNKKNFASRKFLAKSLIVASSCTKSEIVEELANKNTFFKKFLKKYEQSNLLVLRAISSLSALLPCIESLHV